MNPYKEAKLRLGYGLQKKLHQIEREAAEGKLSVLEAKTKLELEWPSVLDLCFWCLEQGDSEDAAAMLLSKLCGVAGQLVFHFLPVSEQIFWRDKGYKAAQQSGLVNDELGHGSQLAYLKFATGQVERAHELLDALLSRNEEALESSGDAKLMGQTRYQRSPEERLGVRMVLLGHRSIFYVAHNRYEEAIPILNEVISYYRQQNNQDALSSTLNTLSVALEGVNKLEEAVQTLDEVIHMGMPNSLPNAYINRGSYLLHLKRREEALESIRQGEKIAIRIADRNAQALASYHFALWYGTHPEAGKRVEAYDYFNKALDYYRSTGDRRQKEKVLKNLDSLLVSVTVATNTDEKQVIEAWRQLANIRDQRDDLQGEASALHELLVKTPDDLESQLEGLIRLGHVCVKQNQYQEAEEHHTKALGIQKRLRARTQESPFVKAEYELYLSLGQAQRHQGQTEAALNSYQQAKELSMVNGDEEARWRAEGNLGLLYVDKGDYPKAIDCLSKVVAHFENPHSNLDDNRLRLLGTARFNLAYAYHHANDPGKAKRESDEALRLLTLINDTAGVAQIKQQVKDW